MSTPSQPPWYELRRRVLTSGTKAYIPFLVRGLAKSGSTHHLLCQHCGILPHFLDPLNRYDGSFPAYVSIFDKAALAIKDHPSSITGEASSNTYTGVLTFCRQGLLLLCLVGDDDSGDRLGGGDSGDRLRGG